MTNKYITNLFALLMVFIAFLLIKTTSILAVTTVNLGTGSNYAVLGASTVTNTGNSVITGDLGLYPGTSITGFPPGTVSGTIHNTNANAQQAQIDITTASASIDSQPCEFNLTNQELGGLTLTPGVYCFASSAQLTGALTLNGQGDASAVFIFKMGSTLTTASASSVVFINGTQACNVFWQVGSSATLGTTTSFKGNIIASQSITLNNGATLEGRALAQNAAVTLDTNTITRAVCATPTTSSDNNTSSSSQGSAPVVPYCPPINTLAITPIIIQSKRVDSDSIYLSWGPYSGVNTFNLQYGFEEGKLLYTTDVTGFSTTINNLHLNQPIWVKIATRNECQIGSYSQSKLIGGPRLPNTGFAPQTDNIFTKIIQQVKNFFLL